MSYCILTVSHWRAARSDLRGISEFSSEGMAWSWSIQHLPWNRNHQDITIQPPWKDCLHLLDQTVETIPQAVCLGYLWSHTESASKTRCGNEHHANYNFLVPLAVFFDHPNPLSAREVMKIVIPPILYTAENWILDEGCLEPLGFQAEIESRILKQGCLCEPISDGHQ